MATRIPFRLKLSGDLSDDHEFQGYDGYMALAGFAWILSLTTNYLETGKIRHRGEFPGRASVIAGPPTEGSLIADFAVLLANPDHLKVLAGIGGTVTTGIVSSAVWDFVKNLNRRHLGEKFQSTDDIVKGIHERHGGDFEALVAATEPAIRQTHQVIGNGANIVNVFGGTVNLNTFNPATKRYVSANVEDRDENIYDFSVAAFNVNSGYGSVFDSRLGRTVPFKVAKTELSRLRQVFTWGLDEYAKQTGKKIRVKYWRIMSMDQTPKRYMIVDAKIMA